jgi:hypothetical protein
MALVQEPMLINDKSSLLEESMLRMARNTLHVHDPVKFIDYVFVHLPTVFQDLADRRTEIFQRMQLLNEPVIRWKKWYG